MTEYQPAPTKLANSVICVFSNDTLRGGDSGAGTSYAHCQAQPLLEWTVGFNVINDIVSRLRADFGQRTLGQLLQDRETAATEIERLRMQIEQLQECIKHSSKANQQEPEKTPPTYTPGSLVSAADVCKLLRISRSAFYLRRTQNDFPKPIQLAPGTVRYEVDAIIAWYKSLGTKS